MSQSNRNVSVVIAVVLMLFVAVLVATQPGDGQATAVPVGYAVLADVDLSSGPFADALVGELVVGDTAVTHLHLALKNLDTPLFTLRLQAENGDAYTILHAENYRTNQDGGGDWEETLPPGSYQLLLTAAQSTGQAIIAHRSQPTN